MLMEDVGWRQEGALGFRVLNGARGGEFDDDDRGRALLIFFVLRKLPTAPRRALGGRRFVQRARARRARAPLCTCGFF